MPISKVLKKNTNTTDCDKCTVSQRKNGSKDICPHSFTTTLQSHSAISVSFVIVDRYGKLVHEFCYTGEDVVLKFMNNVLRCEDLLVNVIKFNEYMLFDEEDKKAFDHESVCFICKNKRLEKGLKEYPFSELDPKVRDHDHLTGKYLGAAHRSCNLNKRREKPFLSIFMHNFSGYDSHLILPFLTKKLFPGIDSVNVIPKSAEKFMSIKINQKITFLDSMSFLSGSLDSLNESIKKSCKYNIINQPSLVCNDDKNNQKVKKPDSDKRIKYLLTKGSFPYEWAKSIDDYSLSQLVPQSAFYNSLTNSNISDENYQLATEVK